MSGHSEGPRFNTRDDMDRYFVAKYIYNISLGYANTRWFINNFT